MRRFRRSFRRGSSRRKRDFLWVASSIALNAPSGTEQQTILSPAQWQVGATVAFERATLVAIRGWLSFKQVTGDAGSFAALYLAIFKASQTIVMNPALIASYDDRDLLWTHGMALMGSDGMSPPGNFNQLQLGQNTLQVDIRVKRKVNSNENINITSNSASGVGQPGYEVTGILRCLVDRT